MSLRPRTVRRLMILLVAVVIVVGTLFGLYLRNENKKKSKLAEWRVAGMAAYEAKDYQGALDSLKLYVARVKTDPQALFAYGEARSRIETSSGSHISEGINIFNAVLQIDPGHREARKRLLDLYTRAGYANEASDLAERVLADEPEDKDALRAKCFALFRLRKLEDALVVSEKLNEIDPADLEQQLFTYRLMRGLKRPDNQLLSRAQRQQQQHKDDPRFELLLAWVYGDLGDTRSCLQWLNTASSRQAPDATFVAYMVRALDQLKLFDQSQQLLDRAVAQNPDPLIGRVLIQRLWQGGKVSAVIDRLAALDPASADADSTLLAYKALALFESNKRDEADKIVAVLAQRKTDSEAVAWATALGTRFHPGEPKANLEKYQAALGRSSENPVIRFLIAETYLRLGETDLAIREWQRVTEMAPSWPTPHMDLARALAASGRIKDAIQEAYLAYRAAPESPAAVTLLVNMRYKGIEQGFGDARDEAALLDLARELQTRVPGEAETLPVYVNLLGRAGKKDQAIAAIKSAMETGRKYEPATMMRLISASRQHKLGLEDELQGAGAGGEQDNPRVALARAADMAAAGKPAEGLTFIEGRAKSATTQPTQWKLAVTQYKELIRDPGVAKEWMALGDAHPNDLPVQLAILKTAQTIRTDREFISRTIDRVKALTGPEAQSWKLERARWLLGSDSPKDAAEAVNTLTEIVRASPSLTEARLLLAAAYESVGNLAAATKELQAAADQEPGRESIQLDTARVLQMQDRFPEALQYLDRAAASTDIGADLRRRVAGMLASQGEFERATRTLESAKQLDSISQILLADIYRRQQRNADAEKIYTALLAKQPLEVDAVRAAADFYAATDRRAEAEKVLARLPEARPRPGIGELVSAAYNEKWGLADVARGQYLAATQAAPSDPTTWRQLISFQLRSGKYDDARQAADDAIRNLPNDATIKRLRGVVTSIAQLAAAEPPMRPVLNVLASSAEERAVVELFGQTSSNTSQPATQSFIELLKSMRERHPRSLPIRHAIVQWHIVMRQLPAAATAAAETMQSFPNDVESARIATNVYRLTRQWDLAGDAAKRWRERSADRPAPADWVMAEIELSRGDASGAIKTLTPYIAQITANVQSEPMVFATLMRAYVAAGREKDAQAALEPLLAKDRMYRILWLELAGEYLTNESVASRWIEQATAMAADDRERLAAAQAWYNLGVRMNSDAAMIAAARVLDPLVARQEATADVVLLRASIADRSGDNDTSKTLYRRGIQLDPKHAGARNNLAYLILLADGDLNEAKTLAMRAVELSPASASYLDTLARIQAKQGDRDGALATFQRALELQPDSIEAMIGMATTLVDAGKREEAGNLLSQINTLVKGRQRLSPQLQRELDALRAVVKASL